MTRVEYTYRGHKFTRFAEGNMTYTYSHETGNMNMRRPGLYRPLAVMDRKPTRAKGVHPGMANDPDWAAYIAKEHCANYRLRRK